MGLWVYRGIDGPGEPCYGGLSGLHSLTFPRPCRIDRVSCHDTDGKARCTRVRILIRSAVRSGAGCAGRSEIGDPKSPAPGNRNHKLTFIAWFGLIIWHLNLVMLIIRALLLILCSHSCGDGISNHVRSSQAHQASRSQEEFLQPEKNHHDVEELFSRSTANI